MGSLSRKRVITCGGGGEWTLPKVIIMANETFDAVEKVLSGAVSKVLSKIKPKIGKKPDTVEEDGYSSDDFLPLPKRARSARFV